jgi:hypothetical protein
MLHGDDSIYPRAEGVRDWYRHFVVSRYKIEGRFSWHGLCQIPEKCDVKIADRCPSTVTIARFCSESAMNILRDDTVLYFLDDSHPPILKSSRRIEYSPFQQVPSELMMLAGECESIEA